MPVTALIPAADALRRSMTLFEPRRMHPTFDPPKDDAERERIAAAVAWNVGGAAKRINDEIERGLTTASWVIFVRPEDLLLRDAVTHGVVEALLAEHYVVSDDMIDAKGNPRIDIRWSTPTR